MLLKKDLLYIGKEGLYRYFNRAAKKVILKRAPCNIPATHCNTLQHTDRHLEKGALQHTPQGKHRSKGVLQHTLQHTATQCNTLQHTEREISSGGRLYCNRRCLSMRHKLLGSFVCVREGRASSRARVYV